MEIKLPLKIIVKVNARKTQLLGYDKEREAFRFEVKAKPEQGKANLEIEKYFSKLFTKPVRIVSGKTGKIRILR